MGTLEMHNVVSVDGYIADEGDHVGPLFSGIPTVAPHLAKAPG